MGEVVRQELSDSDVDRIVKALLKVGIAKSVADCLVTRILGKGSIVDGATQVQISPIHPAPERRPDDETLIEAERELRDLAFTIETDEEGGERRRRAILREKSVFR